MMQTGSTLVECGCTRQKSTASVLIKNIIDASFGAVAWLVCGWGLAFGEDNKSATDGGGYFGTSMFLPSLKQLNSNGNLMVDDFFFQWTFGATTATIVPGAIAER